MANFETEMEHQRKMYESKLKVLEAKIKQAEEDRDNALKQSMKQTDDSNPKVLFYLNLFLLNVKIKKGGP